MEPASNGDQLHIFGILFGIMALCMFASIAYKGLRRLFKVVGLSWSEKSVRPLYEWLGGIVGYTLAFLLLPLMSTRGKNERK